MRKILALASCFFLVLSGKAQEITHENCEGDGSKSVTQEEINHCIVGNYKIAEHILDSVYHDALNHISYYTHKGGTDTFFTVRKAFIKSQQSWVKYRNDATEVIRARYENGSAANEVAWIYKTKMTLERIKELKFQAYNKTALAKPDWKSEP